MWKNTSEKVLTLYTLTLAFICSSQRISSKEELNASDNNYPLFSQLFYFRKLELQAFPSELRLFYRKL